MRQMRSCSLQPKIMMNHDDDGDHHHHHHSHHQHQHHHHRRRMVESWIETSKPDATHTTPSLRCLLTDPTINLQNTLPFRLARIDGKGFELNALSCSN